MRFGGLGAGQGGATPSQLAPPLGVSTCLSKFGAFPQFPVLEEMMRCFLVIGHSDHTGCSRRLVDLMGKLWPRLLTLAPEVAHRGDVLWAGLLGSQQCTLRTHEVDPDWDSVLLSPQDMAATERAALSFVPWRLPEEVNTMTGTWHCLR